MQTRYRAMCLGRPVGPWRSERRQAYDDLAERDLGSYDEWGAFYFDILGDIETLHIRDHAKAA